MTHSSATRHENAASRSARPPSLLPESSKNTCATVLRNQKGHSCEPLPRHFRHDGFDYHQIARERDIAIYEQAADSGTLSYEVVRLRKRTGFFIGFHWIK